MILDFFEVGREYKSSDIATFIGLSIDRTRVYLKELVENDKLESKGANKNKTYYLPEQK